MSEQDVVVADRAANPRLETQARVGGDAAGLVPLVDVVLLEVCEHPGVGVAVHDGEHSQLVLLAEVPARHDQPTLGVVDGDRAPEPGCESIDHLLQPVEARPVGVTHTAQCQP